MTICKNLHEFDGSRTDVWSNRNRNRLHFFE